MGNQGVGSTCNGLHGHSIAHPPNGRWDWAGSVSAYQQAALPVRCLGRGKAGKGQRGNLAPRSAAFPPDPHLLLWIHTKITIAYPSRIFKSTIFPAPTLFSYLLSKKGKALLEEALQIQQGYAPPLPGRSPDGAVGSGPFRTPNLGGPPRYVSSGGRGLSLWIPAIHPSSFRHSTGTPMAWNSRIRTTSISEQIR